MKEARHQRPVSFRVVKNMENQSNKNRRMQAVTFVLCAAVVAFTEFLFIKKPWRYDVMDYWHRGELLAGGEVIDGFRGIIYPVYLAIVQMIGMRKAWFAINALVISLFTSVLIPGLFGRQREPSKGEMIRTVVFTTLLCIFFAGLVAYPLSDMTALTCVCLAVFFARKGIFAKKKFAVRGLSFFLSGIFASFAYNIRTIYLFSVITLILIVFFSDFKKPSEILTKFIKKIESILLMIAGILVGAVPQGMLNMLNLGKWSFTVPSNNLMLRQMVWGITNQRYDTFDEYMLNFPPEHAKAPVYFADIAGQVMMHREGIGEIGTWGELFSLILKYPVDMFALYVRHIVNYVFACFPQIYIYDLNIPKWPMGIAGFTVIFLAVMGAFKGLYLTKKGMIYWLPIVIPALLIVPGAVEYRFSIGLYLFCFYQLCFNFDYAGLRAMPKSEKIKVGALYVIICSLFLAIWGSMLACERLSPLVL